MSNISFPYSKNAQTLESVPEIPASYAHPYDQLPLFDDKSYPMRSQHFVISEDRSAKKEAELLVYLVKRMNEDESPVSKDIAHMLINEIVASRVELPLVDYCDRNLTRPLRSWLSAIFYKIPDEFAK
jgi:hypothetical protein